MVVALLVVQVLAAFLIPIPLYLVQAGDATPTESHIRVGGQASYPSSHPIDYLTVSFRQATVGTLLIGLFDGATEFQRKEQAYPTGNVKKERVENLAAMDNSKVVATVVALRTLGVTVPITGAGARVQTVADGTPANGVLREGDLITALDGKAVESADGLHTILGPIPNGQPVKVTRTTEDGTSGDVTLAKAPCPSDPGRGCFGIEVSTASGDPVLPFKVDIDSGDVGGPSAGLAWTLGVIDRLTPGDLAGKRRVAVTGTISPDGTVGPIGGIVQKAEAAEDAGATLLLYPAGLDPNEVRRAREVAPDLRFKEVGTVEDALKILAPRGVGKITTGH